jgi:hypothetical protein
MHKEKVNPQDFISKPEYFDSGKVGNSADNFADT